MAYEIHFSIDNQRKQPLARRMETFEEAKEVAAKLGDMYIDQCKSVLIITYKKIP